jgi:hypothetical protein
MNSFLNAPILALSEVGIGLIMHNGESFRSAPYEPGNPGLSKDCHISPLC